MSNTTEAPQDSVLRRHWEASRQLQTSHAHAAAPSSTGSSSQASSGGFFSWLKSLFS